MPSTALARLFDGVEAWSLATPTLHEGMDALTYWRGRRARLPWYRVAARREADRMIAAWEPRVRSALLVDPAAPLPMRLSAAGLVVRTRARHALLRARRAALITAVGVGTAFAAFGELLHLIG